MVEGPPEGQRRGWRLEADAKPSSRVGAEAQIKYYIKTNTAAETKGETMGSFEYLLLLTVLHCQHVSLLFCTNACVTG